MATSRAAQAVATFRSEWPRLRPWLALVVLAVLFNLPDAVREATFKWKYIRVSGDLLALLTLGAVATALTERTRRAVRAALVAYGILLFVFRLDRMILGFLMQEEPLLYDQVFMARHLFVLIGDLWSATTAGIVAGFLVLLALLGWSARRLLAVAGTLTDEALRPKTLRVAYVLWLVALPASITDSLALTKRPLVEWLSPKLADNIETSIATFRSVKRGLSNSAYADHDRVVLSRKPDVDIYVVESYGRILWEQGGLRKRHLTFLEALEQRLTAGGWHAASAFSASPVRGARSWLADASMLVGSPIRYEAVFHHTLDQLEKRSTLVKFFQRQGYETVLGAPSNRRRPGVLVTNIFGYDRIVQLDTLKYTGPAVGWGVVPDQYSLSFVEENLVRKATKPRFMNFHLVTSHAPWTSIPERLANWRDLNKVSGKRLQTPSQSIEQTLRRLGHYDRENRDIVYRPYKAKYVDGYVATITYDLDLLADLLVADTRRDRIAIVLGDHQPPLVSPANASYDSPIHVLARDETLLKEFLARGFKKGLRIPHNAESVMGHAGMFSLVVRALTNCCSAVRPLPKFLPHGQELLAQPTRD
jgi:hypothetical protein